jgi:nucleoside 2-deoxyribosyltransferase
MERIYLAGPEVFLPHAVRQLKLKRQCCAEYDFVGVSPLDYDKKATRGLNKKSLHEQALTLARQNEDLIKSSDIVVANLTPFRGPSADVGTVYEVGYARGLGKLVAGYSNSTLEYKQKVPSILKLEPVDANFMHIEDYTQIDNLMVTGGVALSTNVLVADSVESNDLYTNLKNFITCLALLRRYLDGGNS